MKLFHLENMQTQRNPRANAGKVLVTTVAIENKIIGGKTQDQASPLRDHPMYRMIEAYVLAHPTAPSLENPPFLPMLPSAHTPPQPPTDGGATPVMVPVGRPLGLRPVDMVVPRRK